MPPERGSQFLPELSVTTESPDEKAEDIVAGFASDEVEAGLASDEVVAGLASDEVVTAFPFDEVVTAFPFDEVVAGFALDEVVRGTLDGVGMVLGPIVVVTAGEGLGEAALKS